MNHRLYSQIAFVILLMTGCAFKPHNKTTQSAAKLVEGLEVKYDWSNGDGFRLGNRSKAVRRLSLDKDSAYRSDQPVTLPANIPNPIYVTATLPLSTTDNLSFIKANVKIGDRSYQLKVFFTLNSLPTKSVTFEVSGLGTAFEQSVSQSGLLTVEMFNESQKQLVYSFSLRTPSSKIAHEFIDVSTSTEELSLSHQMIAPEISGVRSGMVKILKLTNNESVPVDVQLPTNLSAEVSQEVKRQNYLDQECHGGDFKYWQSTWNDVYSDKLIAVAVDENLLLKLTGFGSDEASNSDDIHMAPNESKYIALYSVSEKAWQLANGTPLTSTVSTQHVPAGCYKFPRLWNEEVTKRFFQDITIGDTRGNIQLRFLENFTAGVRFSDLSLADDSELREMNIAIKGYKTQL